MNRKISMLFARYIGGERRVFIVTRRPAQTLWYLVECKEAGVTALQMSSWALRLAAYIHILRSKYGLDIQTISEPHDGGQHARYVMHTPVEIIEVTPIKD